MKVQAMYVQVVCQWVVNGFATHPAFLQSVIGIC